MKEYINHFQFDTQGVSNLKNNIKAYFNSYNFKLEKEEENHLFYIKKWSFLSGYTLNPLNLKTKIEINITKNQTITINYQVTSNGFGFISPIAFSLFYERFLTNLQHFIISKKKYTINNELLIKSAKKKMLFYIGLLLIGIITCSFIGHTLSDFTGSKLLYYFVFILGIKATTTLINNYLIKTNILQKND